MIRSWLFVVLATLPAVSSAGAPSFRHDVLPVLARHGCSAGSCHGSPTGKGGFRLSLRGFDPELDYVTLVREEGGRRVSRLAPESSLLLAKPTMELSHAGGRKLRDTDPGYAILRDWIAAGCPDDDTALARCERIEVEPHVAELAWPADRTRLRVRAFLADGTTRDITALATFSSSHPAIALPPEVAGEATVRAVSRGEATILVRYQEHVATLDVRFLPDPRGCVWRDPPEHNEIDRLVFARLKQLQIQPSEPCADHEFLRRVFLDLLGVLPTPAEVRAFLADRDPQKRTRLVDRLLERPEHAEYWAQKWADLLRVRGSRLSLPGVHKFHRWLVQAVAEDRPYDQFVAALLTAQGSTFRDPPANFYRAMADTNECAEAFAQLFMGVRIQCAKCHNHPGDRWSQNDYHGLGAFFTRVQRKRGPAPDELFVWLDQRSEHLHPRTNRPIPPTPPGATLPGATSAADSPDRRAMLSQWFTSPANPYLARVPVNRLWGQLFGRGLVEPVDDFRADNPPSHPDLLALLTKRFSDGGYRQRPLLRYILASHVYQLSSKTNDANATDERYFSRAYARMLAAEPLANAIGQATGVSNRFVGLPDETRATNLPSPDFGLDFFADFGQPARSSVCQCERSTDPKLAQALQLINGPFLADKLRDPRSLVARALEDLPQRVASAGQPPQERLVAWFRADLGATTASGSAAADGQSVASWSNLAASDSPVTQPLPAQQPVWQSAAIGGLPGLRFDGRDDFLRHETARLLPAGSPRTVLLVARVANELGGALFTFGRTRTSGAAVFTAQHIQIAGQYYVYSDGVNGSGNTTVPRDRFPSSQQPFLTTFVSRGVGEKLRVDLNGTTLPTAQPGGVGLDDRSPGFTIGSREDLPLGQQLWSGEISEVLVYDRVLSDAELQRAGTYLTTKYQLATTYPRAPLPAVAGKSNEEIVVELYLAAFSRPPTAAELAWALKYVQELGDRRQGLDDIAWALLNSKEFLFRH